MGDDTQHCVIFTADTCVSGIIPMTHPRFSETLNALTTSLLRVRDATVQTRTAEGAELWAVESALVRMSEVVFCYPEDIEVGARRSYWSNRQERTPSSVVVLLDGRTVTGLVHLPPRVPLLDYLLTLTDRFLPVTDATISKERQGLELPFVLVNAHLISTFYETSEASMVCSFAATGTPESNDRSRFGVEVGAPLAIGSALDWAQPTPRGVVVSMTSGPGQPPQPSALPPEHTMSDSEEVGPLITVDSAVPKDAETQEMSSTTELRHTMLGLASRGGGNGALARWAERRKWS